MRDQVRYWLERLLLRGPQYRLALIAVVIVVVSVVGGLLALLAAGGDFDSAREAIWWAFLRLTDPGYLGDDEGTALRVVSTAVTVSGYVLFMGALIAVMTQALNQTIERLERGETPIAMEGHLLVLGWTDRSAAIIREFLLSERRVARFLERRGAERLRVVLMVDHLDPDVQSEIAGRFGDLWDERVVTLRAGSRLRLDHLERVAFDRAAAIVLPGNESAQDLAQSDVATIKTLLSIANHPAVRAGARPRVVAEVFDRRKVDLAMAAYEGEVDVVPSDLYVSRLIVQNIRSPGLSHVYNELLTHRGAAVYARHLPNLAGSSFDEVSARLDRGVLLGAVRREGGRPVAHLCPKGSFAFAEEDRLVIVAEHYEDSEPGPSRQVPLPGRLSVVEERARARRVLVLGWADTLPVILGELATHGEEIWAVDVMSLLTADHRAALLAAHGALPSGVTVRQLEGDFTLPTALAAVEPHTYDNVVLLGSDWLRSDEEADARTLVGYLTLRQVLREAAVRPDVLVELTDPSNAALFHEQADEVLVSPLVVSNLLAHATLRGEILPVFDALLGAGGPAFLFREAAAYGLEGRVTFDDVFHAVHRHGHVAIGVRRLGDGDPAERLQLVPPRGTRVDLAAHDLVVLAPTVPGPAATS